jgi:hypothetical protein
VPRTLTTHTIPDQTGTLPQLTHAGDTTACEARFARHDCHKRAVGAELAQGVLRAARHRGVAQRERRAHARAVGERAGRGAGRPARDGWRRQQGAGGGDGRERHGGGAGVGGRGARGLGDGERRRARVCERAGARVGAWAGSGAAATEYAGQAHAGREWLKASPPVRHSTAAPQPHATHQRRRGRSGRSRRCMPRSPQRPGWGWCCWRRPARCTSPWCCPAGTSRSRPRCR